tara:strand:- start:752 stop:895 length:144 start_codon:yes stop_codon:yes gene_type:complete
MRISIDPTEVQDLPCEVCGVFTPEDEMYLDGLCYDCWEEFDKENEKL